MANKIVHAAQRKAFEVVLDAVGKKARKSRGEGYVDVINSIQKLLVLFDLPEKHFQEK